MKQFGFALFKVKIDDLRWNLKLIIGDMCMNTIWKIA